MSSTEERKSDAGTAPAKKTDVPTGAAVVFPVAEIRDATAGGILRQSGMWWITALCLIGAIILAWQSIPEHGTSITIHFPEGHGLKPDDSVRFRGIEVGTVTAVALNADLSRVDVSVTLTPGGGALDKEGTRFWIVRPRFSLTEISGLETAVGAKYIGVSPGDPAGKRCRDFEGLAAVPPDELDHGGLEIVLRSDDRHGTSPGAPVTWRGVKAGKVLSINLSPDARHVNVTVRIDRAYRRLVRSSSKFWVTSGFGVDVSLTGVKLNAQSLTTIIQGGVSFISPSDGTSQDSVRNGHVFVMADTAEKGWLAAAANIPLIDFALPETVLVRGERKSSLLGIFRSKDFTQTGLLVADADGAVVMTPTLPVTGDTDVMANFQISQSDSSAVDVVGISASECNSGMAGVLKIPVAEVIAISQWNDFRVPGFAEDCVVVRSAVMEGKSTPLIQAIDVGHLSPQANDWVINNDNADFSEWHGAPVVAMADGRIIGFLLTDSGRPLVVCFRKGSDPEQ